MRRRGLRGTSRGDQFVCPHDPAYDSEGSIYVSEWVEVGRVTKLRKV